MGRKKMRRVLGEEDPDAHVPLRGRWAGRPSMEEIEWAAANEFGVEVGHLQAKRVKNNLARAAALCLVRRLTSVPVTQLADRYRGVSQAANSKAVKPLKRGAMASPLGVGAWSVWNRI